MSKLCIRCGESHASTATMRFRAVKDSIHGMFIPEVWEGDLCKKCRKEVIECLTKSIYREEW